MSSPFAVTSICKNYGLLETLFEEIAVETQRFNGSIHRIQEVAGDSRFGRNGQAGQHHDGERRADHRRRRPMMPSGNSSGAHHRPGSQLLGAAMRHRRLEARGEVTKAIGNR